jgi:hypothetical protein
MAEPAIPTGQVEWRVDRRMTALKAAGAVLFVVAGLVFGGGDVLGLALALLVAAGLAGFALRDVLAPVRLAADGHGVTVVTGFSTRRRIPWSEIERVRVDVRQRLGRRSALLEIDTGETLHLFSAAELSTDLDDVAATLVTLRTGR